MKPNRLKKSHRDFATVVDKKVGARIAERRALADLTQTDLGMPVGVTTQQAQRYEAGQTPLPIATLISIARTLGCRPSELLVDFDGPQDGAPEPLEPEVVAIAKSVQAIKNGGLRGIVKAVAEKIRTYERMVEKNDNA